MQPEVIAFAAHRWAELTKLGNGTQLRYGVGKLCSTHVVFPTHTKALLAKINWMEQGIEPHTDTLKLWPAVTDEQVEANRP